MQRRRQQTVLRLRSIVENLARMAAVNLLNIAVVNNPAQFADPFVFEITFECFAALAEGTLAPNWPCMWLAASYRGVLAESAGCFRHLCT